MFGSVAGARRQAAAVLVGALTAAGTVGVAAALVTAPAADAQGMPTAQATVPSAVPTTNTPDIQGGVVFAVTSVGNTVVVGGGFTNVKNHGSGTLITRKNLIAYDATTGQVVSSFAPSLNGVVESVAPGPTANSVYVAGLFTTVNGVASPSITLLDTSTGAIVSGFTPPTLNGGAYSVTLGGGHLFVGGAFTTASGAGRKGLVSLNPTTGALDSFATVGFTGHHNYVTGSGTAQGVVGPRSMSVNPAGTRLVVVGNFTTAGGLARDQFAMIDIDGATAAVDPNFATQQFTAKCNSTHFDSYVTDVQFSPDGSYFATSNTGGTGGSSKDTNSDGSRGLCDSTERWNMSSSGTSVKPLWVDYTGVDTLWSVAVTGAAIYVGGHERWLNNANGNNNAGGGAVPRPGLAAIDPISGLPLAWNPGRNPRGVGAYSIYADANAVYVGSDTDYIGNRQYKHMKIASFPLSGGYTPADTTTTSLPANLYLAGPLSTNTNDSAVDHLDFRAVNGSSIGSLLTQSSPIAWSSTRGAFMVGSSIFYPSTNGNLYRASFDGSKVGTPVLVDPYHDPYWDGVATGSGSSVYTGQYPSYYSTISSITGEFYTAGKLYYTLAGSTTMHWRWFSPDSGTIGTIDNTVTATNFSATAGMVLSGSTLYFAKSTDGTLHTETFSNGAPVASTDRTISGPAIDGRDWRARGLFLNGTPKSSNAAPTASATSSCAGLTCTFDGSSSTDSDGTIDSYAWNFGDGATASGAQVSHTYAGTGDYQTTLTVTDNNGAASAPWSGTASVVAPAAIAYLGGTDTNANTANPSVTVPSGVTDGSTELLVATVNSAGLAAAAPTGLDGWTQLADQVASPAETLVWQRTASATDAGQQVTVPLSKSTLVDVQLVVYSGVSTSANAVVATTTDSSSQTHVAPAVTVSTTGSWVLSYWTQKTSSTSSWTAPAGVVTRQQGVGSSANHIDSLLADSGAAQSAGTYPAQTADAGVVGGRGIGLSIVLAPAPSQ